MGLDVNPEHFKDSKYPYNFEQKLFVDGEIACEEYEDQKANQQENSSCKEYIKRLENKEQLAEIKEKRGRYNDKR